MFNEDNNGYADDAHNNAEFEHNRRDFYSGECNPEKHPEKEGAMPKIKVIELLLAAVYTLISAALSVVKFINQVGKLKNAGA
ncbi:hypothetical protein FACS1894171_2300 [Clostridia bacterium]|nr:hypothetical protein FACS1894171_2300 [Clostridia bacterium]